MVLLRRWGLIFFKSKVVSSKRYRNAETVSLRFSGCPVWGVNNAVFFCEGTL